MYPVLVAPLIFIVAVATVVVFVKLHGIFSDFCSGIHIGNGNGVSCGSRGGGSSIGTMQGPSRMDRHVTELEGHVMLNATSGGVSSVESLEFGSLMVGVPVGQGVVVVGFGNKPEGRRSARNVLEGDPKSNHVGGIKRGHACVNVPGGGSVLGSFRKDGILIQTNGRDVQQDGSGLTQTKAQIPHRRNGPPQIEKLQKGQGGTTFAVVVIIVVRKRLLAIVNGPARLCQ